MSKRGIALGKRHRELPFSTLLEEVEERIVSMVTGFLN